MASVSNKNRQANQSDTKTSTRDRRSASARPAPADIAAEAAAIYPDTFAPPPSPSEIAAEAYAIYLSRGGAHGRDEDDWLEAERRLADRRRG